MKNLRYMIATSVLMVVTLILIVACEDKQEKIVNEVIPTTTKQPVQQVNFLGQWLNEGKREKLVRDFTRQYEFENQHILMNLKFPEEVYYDRTISNSNQLFISQIIKDPNPKWDIIRLNDQYEEVLNITGDSLWAKNNLVDFSSIAEFRRTTRTDLLNEKVKKRWGGIIPGPFIEGQYWAMWSNANVARKVGIEIKQQGMTVDDFVGYIKAVHQYNEANPGDYIQPMHEAGDWTTVNTFVFQMYASALNDYDQLFTLEVTEKKLEAWHKTLTILEELSKYNILNPEWKNVSWSDSKFDLINEQCLFYSNGSWMYNIWNEENPESTMSCFPNEYPTFNETSIYPGGYLVMWGVLKKSPNKQAAIDFLLAMNKPDVAEMWVQYTKCPTGIKGKLTDVSFGTDQFENFSSSIQTKFGSNTYKPTAESFQYITGSINKNTYYVEVMLGEITADEAIQNIRLGL
ncbi:MAG: ABC transporter substrate-binding protein [Salinivirgaceae bacterium]|jgi:hypothetical protein|nr:ABC transporter substrate-binding protein [Salinivirgaceae bacterium]